jgi:uncharacterized membrane protein YqaE (UPF0057 family)
MLNQSYRSKFKIYFNSISYHAWPLQELHSPQVQCPETTADDIRIEKNNMPALHIPNDKWWPPAAYIPLVSTRQDRGFRKPVPESSLHPRWSLWWNKAFWLKQYFINILRYVGQYSNGIIVPLYVILQRLKNAPSGNLSASGNLSWQVDTRGRATTW